MSSVKQGLGDSKKKFVHLARLYDIWPEVYGSIAGNASQDAALPVLPSKVFINTKVQPRTMKITVMCPAAMGPRLSLQKGILLEKINFLMGDPVATDIVFDHRL